MIDPPGASTARLYVVAATLNGVPVAGAYVEHADVVAGATLRLTMSDVAP